ncbi:MAG TPA: NAD-dependent epimerase/dehydratase family protein [Pirellulales bacterium]|nr:NAD-dependent epimerase/dehydratase family protein [Pirellulales bacterium]
MHILVTGGAGFIGSHLIEALLALGHDVAAVDNFSLGSHEQLAHLAGQPRFRLHPLDILDAAAFGAVMGSENFDCVFHLAANSDIARSHDDPGVDFRNTLETTYTVLTAMRTHGVKQIVFASTSAIYGDAACALDENHGPLLPVSHYGAAKLASEAFISSFVANYGMQAWIARFANIVGERATHGALFDFINRLRRDPDHLPVRGNGEQAKPYLYVKELVEALLFIWQNADDPLNVFNVGVDSRTSVKQIVRTVTDEMRVAPEVHYEKSATGWVGDVAQVRYRVDKLGALGWHARRTSDEAVQCAVRAMLETSS